MQEIINLDPSDYYTQRNNQIRPVAACMPTSYVMFLRGNGIDYRNNTDMADDDYFMETFNHPQSWSIAKQKYRNLVIAGYPPNEIHGMYHTYLDYKIIGRRVSDFVTDLTFDDFIDRIRLGRVIMTSGAFVQAGLSGHAFCVMGIEAKPPSGPIKLILADPWGDYKKDYRSTHGYGVLMSKADFTEHVKPSKKYKWGHVII
jgi:hypothetical protein